MHLPIDLTTEVQLCNGLHIHIQPKLHDSKVNMAHGTTPCSTCCLMLCALQILRRIISTGGARCMRPLCIVTNTDVADKGVGRDIRRLRTSSTIKRITAYVAGQLGLNPNLVRHMIPY